MLETIARGNGTLFSAKLLEKMDEKTAGESEGLSDLFSNRYLVTITLGEKIFDENNVYKVTTN